MKKLVNAIKDFFYEITDHTLILIVIITIGIILVWRFNMLFDFSVNKTVITGDKLPEIEKKIETSPEVIQSQENADDAVPKNPKTEATYTIIVPSGSTAIDIAELLYSKKVITDKASFLNRSVELKLDTKLKSGTFEINSNNTLDEIIKIISMTK